jgi:hypothetical protein
MLLLPFVGGARCRSHACPTSCDSSHLLTRRPNGNLDELRDAPVRDGVRQDPIDKLQKIFCTTIAIRADSKNALRSDNYAFKIVVFAAP